MKSMVPLLEVVHQFDEVKFRQHVGNKLAARVTGLLYVHVDISHQDGVLSP